MPVPEAATAPPTRARGLGLPMSSLQTFGASPARCRPHSLTSCEEPVLLLDSAPSKGSKPSRQILSGSRQCLAQWIWLEGGSRGTLSRVGVRQGAVLSGPPVEAGESCFTAGPLGGRLSKPAIGRHNWIEWCRTLACITRALDLCPARHGSHFSCPTPFSKAGQPAFCCKAQGVPALDPVHCPELADMFFAWRV